MPATPKKGRRFGGDSAHQRLMMANLVSSLIAAEGIITTEAPIDASNVQLVVKVDGKEVVTRVGYERREVTKRRPDGSEYETTRSVRIARKTGKEI